MNNNNNNNDDDGGNNNNDIKTKEIFKMSEFELLQEKNKAEKEFKEKILELDKTIKSVKNKNNLSKDYLATRGMKLIKDDTFKLIGFYYKNVMYLREFKVQMLEFDKTWDKLAKYLKEIEKKDKKDNIANGDNCDNGDSDKSIKNCLEKESLNIKTSIALDNFDKANEFLLMAVDKVVVSIDEK